MAAGGMHLIGRVSASAVANLSTSSLMNFDFSLVKINAPHELMPLGECLSNNRRQKAENGAAHILARRLGALFDGLVEETPKLLVAYGLRASDIAKTLSESNLNSAGKPKHGVFSNYAGVDGTTIWAAATSGPTALRLHLLACMLARLWSPQEATAIWVELVQERQRELRLESEKHGYIGSAAHAAAHIPIEENHLGDWDASARAWILSADKAMQLRQTQLMLIINNLSLNVDSDNEPVYHSVISVWRRAMVAMEKLVDGIGQSVESGAVLLGLSAWHLYPDLLVLGSKTREIYQKDTLVGQGGLLTIGLTAATSDAEGIHWSLPLASLRYYGGPAYTRRTTRQDSTRLSVNQLQMVAMGALLGHWNSTTTPDDFAKFIIVLWELFKAFTDQQLEWELKLNPNDCNPDLLRKAMLSLGLHRELRILQILGGLVNGATEFLELAQDALRRRVALQLLGYGKRHGQRWLGLSLPGVPNLFGLNEISHILPLLHPDSQVAVLRELIPKYGILPTKRTIIRYKPDHIEQNKIEWEFALPSEITNTTSSTISNGHTAPRQVRACVATRVATRYIPHMSYESSDDKVPVALSPEVSSQYQKQRTKECGENFETSRYFHYLEVPEFDATHFEMQWKFDLSPLGEWVLKDTSETLGQEETVLFKYVFGYAGCAAVYTQFDPYAKRRGKPNIYNFELDIQQVCSLLEMSRIQLRNYHHDRVRVNKILSPLAQHLSEVFDSRTIANPGPWGDSLAALSAISDLYSRYLPNASLSMAVTSVPLKEAKWHTRFTMQSRNTRFMTTKPSQSSPRSPSPPRAALSDLQWPLNMNRVEMFACVLQMESGTINADPASLSNVFAISSGNSLFVAAQLLEDPHIELPTDAVMHIEGNIGKAGIALLIPPSQPRVRELELGEWEVIVHAPFDGVKQNGLFESTTMHLSPTGYELNYDTGTHGLRGRQAFFVETRVSVHDRGKWVADVDPLAAFAVRQLQRYVPDRIEMPCCCSDNKYPAIESMTSIDCWEELLDLPIENEIGVVRAAGSWMARIAAVGIAVQKGECLILPDMETEFCWNCFNSWRSPAQRSTGNLDLSSVPLKTVVFVW